MIHAGPLVSEVAQLQSVSWGALGSVIIVLPVVGAGILVRRVGAGAQFPMPLFAAGILVLFIGLLLPTVSVWVSLALAFVVGLILGRPRSIP